MITVIFALFDVHVDPTKFESQEKQITLPPLSIESQESDTEVTLPLLLSLPLSPGKFVNLTQVVGDKCFAFGVHLLNDESGKLMQAIVADNQKQTEPIVTEIFIKWIAGVGKTKTWGSLADAFERIRDKNTAGDIRRNYCNN